MNRHIFRLVYIESLNCKYKLRVLIINLDHRLFFFYSIKCIKKLKNWLKMNFDIFWTQFICRHALFCTRSHYVYFVSCIFSSSPIFWSSFSCCLLLLFILTVFVYRCTCVRTVVTPRRSQRCTMSTSRSSTPSHPPSSSSTTSAISSLATAISPTCCSPAAETGSSHAAETGSSPAAETGSSPAAETGSSSCS